MKLKWSQLIDLAKCKATVFWSERFLHENYMEMEEIIHHGEGELLYLPADETSPERVRLPETLMSISLKSIRESYKVDGKPTRAKDPYVYVNLDEPEYKFELLVKNVPCPLNLKAILKINNLSHLLTQIENVNEDDAYAFVQGMLFITRNWDCEPNGAVINSVVRYLTEKHSLTNDEFDTSCS